MRPIAILAMVGVCVAAAACAPLPAPGPAAAKLPPCQSSTVPVTVGGRSEQAAIEACPQPDGSWRVTQTTPGLPPQVYVMPAPPPEAYPSAYPESDYDFDYWPYWAGPWFWGIGPSVVIVQHFHHFHHFDHFGHFAYGHPVGAGHPAPDFGHAAGAPAVAVGMHR